MGVLPSPVSVFSLFLACSSSLRARLSTRLRLNQSVLENWRPRTMLSTYLHSPRPISFLLFPRPPRPRESELPLFCLSLRWGWLGNWSIGAAASVLLGTGSSSESIAVRSTALASYSTPIVLTDLCVDLFVSFSEGFEPNLEFEKSILGIASIPWRTNLSPMGRLIDSLSRRECCPSLQPNPATLSVYCASITLHIVSPKLP